MRIDSAISSLEWEGNDGIVPHTQRALLFDFPFVCAEHVGGIASVCCIHALCFPSTSGAVSLKAGSSCKSR